MKARALWVIGAAFLPLLTSCSHWEDEALIEGIAYERVKIDREGHAVRGILSEDTDIAGRPCNRGWVHLHENGVPALYEAANDIVLPTLTIPAGTWVRQDPLGRVIVCAFPTNHVVQGYLCRGTGGPKGVQVAFYPNGRLRQFYPVHPITIDGVTCDTGLVRGWVELYEDGRLSSARLSEDLTVAGGTYRAGARLRFDRNGRPMNREPVIWMYE